MKAIKINCTAKDFLKLETLAIFQGNLKELSKENYEKLKAQILKQGFISPIHVWQSSEGKNYILDGTQRFNTLTAMQKEGFEIPELPCTFIHADSYKAASEILLSLVSQYGKVTEEGLYEFASTHEIDLSSIKDEYEVPLDMDKFLKSYNEEIEIKEKMEKEFEEKDISDKEIECPKCGYKWYKRSEK